MLPGNDGPADATAVSVCLILNHLSLSNRQHVGAIVKEGALPRIVGISRRDGGSVGATHSSTCLSAQFLDCFNFLRNGPSRAGQAARVLLHTMWKYSDLHGTYRKVSPDEALLKVQLVCRHLVVGIATLCSFK